MSPLSNEMPTEHRFFKCEDDLKFKKNILRQYLGTCTYLIKPSRGSPNLVGQTKTIKSSHFRAQVHPGELNRVNSDSALPVTERENEEEEEELG
jgi:hypothetical protein